MKGVKIVQAHSTILLMKSGREQHCKLHLLCYVYYLLLTPSATSASFYI